MNLALKTPVNASIFEYSRSRNNIFLKENKSSENDIKIPNCNK